MKGFRTVLNWTLAALLLPALWAAVKQLAGLMPGVGAHGFRVWGVYIAGAVVYLTWERVTAKPMVLYVIGHELTHAVSGLLTGAKIYSLKATAKGGEVKLSKSNGLIALSPYIVPFYTVLLLGFYALVRLHFPNPWLDGLFRVLLGASLAFHFSLTFNSFHSRQSDLKLLGFFCSTVLIGLGNALILGLLCISLFSRMPSIPQYFSAVGRDTLSTWKSGAVLLRDKASYLIPVNRLKEAKWIH